MECNSDMLPKPPKVYRHLTLSTRRKKRRNGKFLVLWRQQQRLAEISGNSAVANAVESISVERNAVDNTPVRVQHDYLNIGGIAPLDDSESAVELQNSPALSAEADDQLSDLLVEPNQPQKTFDLSGRRIVDLNHVIEGLRGFNRHGSITSCGLDEMEVTNEVQRGYNSILKLTCRMCGHTESLFTDPPRLNQIDVNSAAISGATAIGIGYSQLTELTAAMDIPSISSHTYAKYDDKVSNGWMKTALNEMRAAAAEEAEIALQLGQFRQIGDKKIPILTVVCDGVWSKRSYRKNYNALSGIAAIVGFYTKKVIFMGVRNKYCTVCDRHDTAVGPVPEHHCFKNWKGTSTSMEADIILEGFCRSEDMYGVMYGYMVADGDSSVYKSLLERQPYIDLTVEKIECRNHLLRNYCDKLKAITVDSSLPRSINARKILGAKIKKLRTAVTCAIKYRKCESNTTEGQKISNLKSDILNGPLHVFGDHAKCANYFCSGPKEGEINYVPEFRSIGVFHKIMKELGRVVDNARSLLKDVDSNSAEQFNSTIAKLVGGKRVNFSLKGGYGTRGNASVVVHNSRMPQFHLHKTVFGASPGKHSKKFELRRKRLLDNQRKKRLEEGYVRRKIIREKAPVDKDYGPNAQKPDLPEELFKEKCSDFLKGLEMSPEERRQLERDTIEQSESGAWLEKRRKLITASIASKICRRRPTTSCKSLVAQLLHKEPIDSLAMRHGRENEASAILDLERCLNADINPPIKIEKCGLFIDEDLPFLGATPDGLVGSDGIVKVKCPLLCINLTPEEAIAQKVKSEAIRFWQVGKSGEEEINTASPYFYQIQMQLHVTKRSFCAYAVWTPHGLKVERVYRNDEFWIQNMESQLTSFYMDCLLPELVDSRHRRSMPIRDPSYITDAIERQRKRKLELAESKSLKKKLPIQ